MFTKTKNIIGMCVAVVVIVLVGYALNNLVFHWGTPSVKNSRHSAVAPSGPAELTHIEPLNLNCRTAVSAKVPVNAHRRHQFTINAIFASASLGYRNDHVSLKAVGDVDWCLPPSASVIVAKDGGWDVTVSASKIIFRRPRVDAIATASSVRFGKGWIGKLTDVFPWVNETNGLMPAGYAYAQSVIGGSSCMGAAWIPARTTISAAYRLDAIDKHIDPNKVKVHFSGAPNFKQHDNDLKPAKFHGFTFDADPAHAKCIVQRDALLNSKQIAPQISHKKGK